jgi:hypothetical protein
MDRKIPSFTGYQKFVVGVLAFLQFTIILDFMILSPLGAILMPALKIERLRIINGVFRDFPPCPNALQNPYYVKYPPWWGIGMAPRGPQAAIYGTGLIARLAH